MSFKKKKKEPQFYFKLYPPDSSLNEHFCPLAHIFSKTFLKVKNVFKVLIGSHLNQSALFSDHTVTTVYQMYHTHFLMF